MTQRAGESPTLSSAAMGNKMAHIGTCMEFVDFSSGAVRGIDDAQVSASLSEQAEISPTPLDGFVYSTARDAGIRTPISWSTQRYWHCRRLWFALGLFRFCRSPRYAPRCLWVRSPVIGSISPSASADRPLASIPPLHQPSTTTRSNRIWRPFSSDLRRYLQSDAHSTAGRSPG